MREAFPALDVRAIDVPDENWAARSQAALRAIRVGRIIVAPPWDVPDVRSLESEAIVIIIQPSTGFGTGHHATTRLCLAALQQIELRGKSVFDVGTGSGVLAIAASLLGAADAVGVDDDADAIAAARENLTLNPAARVHLQTRDVRTSNPESRIPNPESGFDVVVANLTGGLLEATAQRLQSFAGPGGHLVLSGFLDFEQPRVLRTFSGCTVQSDTREDEWMCVVLRKA